MLRIPALLFVTALIAGCAGGGATPYPKLVPMDSLLSDEAVPPNPAPELAARADSLRARAAQLRKTSVSDASTPQGTQPQ